MIIALLAGAAIFMQTSTVLPPTREKAPMQTAGAIETTTTIAPKTVSPVTVTPGHKEAPPEIAQNKLVCHDETPVGTLFARKVCATAQEFADRTKSDQQQVRDWQHTAISGKQSQ